MRDCRTFLDIPPMVHWEDGSTCINPDFEMVRKFHLAAKAKDPAFPERGLVPEVTIAPDEEVDFQLTVEREENGMGHLLINELLMLTDPAGAGSLKVDIKSIQADRTYTNSSVFNWTVFGNSHLNTCLPCPILLFPNQTVIIKVKNFESVPVTVSITARGKRFMPYHNMGLVRDMERCWSQNPTIPMWLGLDNLQTEIPAGGRAQGQVTVPGGGYFELKYIRGKVQPVGSVDFKDILVNVTEGRIGRRLMNEPIPLNLYATEDRNVPGFPGGVFRSASASHCPAPPMIFRGNTRIIHDFQNLSTLDDAFVELTYVGCFHYASKCPPGALLEEVRRGVGVFSSPMIDGGWGAYEDGSYDGGIWDPNYDCGPPAMPGPPAQLPGAPPLPEPPVIVSMHRPGKAYFGPGSSGALPYHMSWGVDQYGKTHLVVRDTNTGQFVRFATGQELSPFKSWQDQINQRNLSGLGGLGRPPQGEWEKI
jgi:hypothetical protein